MDGAGLGPPVDPVAEPGAAGAVGHDAGVVSGELVAWPDDAHQLVVVVADPREAQGGQTRPRHVGGADHRAVHVDRRQRAPAVGGPGVVDGPGVLLAGHEAHADGRAVGPDPAHDRGRQRHLEPLEGAAGAGLGPQRTPGGDHLDGALVERRGRTGGGRGHHPGREGEHGGDERAPPHEPPQDVGHLVAEHGPPRSGAVPADRSPPDGQRARSAFG